MAAAGRLARASGGDRSQEDVVSSHRPTPVGSRSRARPVIVASLAAAALLAACQTPGRPITGGSDEARYACSQEAQRRGFYVVGIHDVDRRGDDEWRVRLTVARDGRQYDARCDYDEDDRDADLRVRD